jgi:6-hydroxytryprostatin B O-methyltransferase
MHKQQTTTLEGLAATILEKVVVVSRQLGAESIPAPTFAESGHNDYAGESLDLRQARYDLAAAAKSLWLLAQGPEDQIISLKWAPSDTANLDVLLRFNILEAIPLDGTISSEDLAKKVELPLDITERMVRYAIGNGLFIEPSPGTFAHSAASSRLTRSTHLRHLAVGSCGMHARFVGRIADALFLQQQARLGTNQTLLEGNEPGYNPEAPFNLAYPGYKNVFDFAAQNKRAAEIYHRAMVARANLPRWKMSHILQARDWSSVGDATIVDVSNNAPCRLFTLDDHQNLTSSFFH